MNSLNCKRQDFKIAPTVGLLYQSSQDHCHYDLIPLDYDFSRVKKKGSCGHTSVQGTAVRALQN